MPEEAGDVSKAVGFVAVDGVVVFGEGGFEELGPEPVELCEALADEAVEFGIGTFLGAAFDDHGGKFGFLPWWEVDFHEFVTAFFEVDAGHDGEVDGSSKIDKISVALVLDFHLPFFFGFFVVRTILVVVFVIIVTPGCFSQNLGFQFLIGLFMLLPLRIELKNIETILNFDIII